MRSPDYDRRLLVLIRNQTEPRTLTEILGRHPTINEVNAAARLWVNNLVTRDNKGRYEAVPIVVKVPVKKPRKLNYARKS
jgi:hypothetical protein